MWDLTGLLPPFPRAKGRKRTRWATRISRVTWTRWSGWTCWRKRGSRPPSMYTSAIEYHFLICSFKQSKAGNYRSDSHALGIKIGCVFTQRHGGCWSLSGYVLIGCKKSISYKKNLTWVFHLCVDLPLHLLMLYMLLVILHTSSYSVSKV